MGGVGGIELCSSCKSTCSYFFVIAQECVIGPNLGIMCGCILLSNKDSVIFMGSIRIFIKKPCFNSIGHRDKLSCVKKFEEIKQFDNLHIGRVLHQKKMSHVFTFH